MYTEDISKDKSPIVKSKVQEFSQFYPVIMAGGSGTRFWPVSRRARPKQFLQIGTQHALIVETLERIKPLAAIDHSYILAGDHHQEQLQSLLGDKDYHYIFEPCARNTAACVGLAAIHIAHHNPQAVMGILPADHHIAHIPEFHQAIEHAIQGALAGEIVTFGIKPTRAETGYGYLKYEGGGVLHQSRLKVEQFVEKPPQMIAQRYFESGEYLWNSGMFFFKAAHILKEFQKQLPDLYLGLQKIAHSIGKADYQHVLTEVFHTFKSISLDVGIMENATQVTLIPVDFAWNDVGHWAALSDFVPKDEQSNIWQGKGTHVAIDAHGNIVQSDKLVALLGVDHMVLVETDDVLMLCARSHTQHIKKIIQALQQTNQSEFL